MHALYIHKSTGIAVAVGLCRAQTEGGERRVGGSSRGKDLHLEPLLILIGSDSDSDSVAYI